MANTHEREQLDKQAADLRRAGKSRREIRQLLGVSNRTLDRALHGVPPPPWTGRPRAKDEVRARARELRIRGYTYTEIAAELSVSRSSVSLWTRDLPRVGRISYEEIRKRKAEGAARYWASEGPRRKARRQAISDDAASEIGPLTKREILIAGAIAYWCEGAKSKAYRPSEQMTFINSDPQLIQFYMRFLAAAGVAPDRLVCRLHIHESADVAAAQKFWLGVTGLPDTHFKRPTLKHHNPRTVRKNTGEDYHGCLIIRVLQGAELYRQVEGWARAAMGTSWRDRDQEQAAG